MKTFIDDSYLENDVVIHVSFSKKEKEKLKELGYAPLPNSTDLFHENGSKVGKEKRITLRFQVKNTKVVGFKEIEKRTDYILRREWATAGFVDSIYAHKFGEFFTELEKTYKKVYTKLLK